MDDGKENIMVCRLHIWKNWSENLMGEKKEAGNKLYAFGDGMDPFIWAISVPRI